MREIKFRAWDKDEKVMRDWSNLHECGYANNKDTIFNDPDFDIMQYTGLLDKNGVGIYEGDILAHISTRRAGYGKDGDMIYCKIVFGNTNTRESTLTAYVGFWAVSLSDEDIDCGGSIKNEVESHGAIVIGNIHENPDLLEDK